MPTGGTWNATEESNRIKAHGMRQRNQTEESHDDSDDFWPCQKLMTRTWAQCTDDKNSKGKEN